MQNKFKSIFSPAIFFALIFSVVFLAHFVHAATPNMYFVSPINPIGVDDEFSVEIHLDSAGEKVNTVAGDLVFSDQLLAVENVSTANSIVSSYWIQPPVISGNSVTFSG